MSAKHTPGPWCVKPYNWQRGNVSVFAPKYGRAPYGACVAYTPCSDGVGGADGALANAHLIAAAPTMYEALKQIEPILARMYGPQAAELPPMQIVRAAIAKAEGA